ncbi:MAG: nucleotidyltransferase domain-containing protein [Eggerthellaceae bacterium]|nr:nucleotidyltransferase domain-containing protein [Eggerthellaceae bacterium]
MDSAALDLALAFAEEAQRHFPDSYVFLFGSHAKGTARPSSDIDVAVIVDGIEGYEEDPWLGIMAKRLLHGISEESFYPVEGHLFQADHSQSGIINNILETGIQLLGPYGSLENQFVTYGLPGDEPVCRLMQPA